MAFVGARGLVHKPQFNGKQESKPPRGELDLRCPRNGQQTGIFAPLSSFATERPETGAWEGDEGCSAQPGYRPTRWFFHRRAERSCTVGEGGENTFVG